MKDQLIAYMRAGYPCLFLVTNEEQRASAEIAAACAFESKEQKIKSRPDVFHWSCTAGIVSVGEDARIFDGTAEPEEMLKLFQSEQFSPRSVLVAHDFHLFLGDNAYPQLVRRLRETLAIAKSCGKCIIITGAVHKLPPELQKEVTVLEFKLPDAEQLRDVLRALLTTAKKPLPEADAEKDILRAAGGLTTTEAENAFSLSLVKHGEVVPREVAKEKAATVKKNGLLKIFETDTDLSAIGGLDMLKEWLRRRRNVSTDAARAYGLAFPKGVFLFGPPGTGKSLSAKATAATLGGLPLLQCDIGAIFGSLVGQSEANIRTMIQTAEAVAPCVLWIDELDKALQGMGSSGSTDGGTGARVLGSILQWMTEKKSEVFVVATANHPERLPAEILRKGRWDELFFVDLPNKEERRAIWEIQIRKNDRLPENFDLGLLITASDGFTGAEIEAVIKDAMCSAFSEDGRELTTDDILSAIQSTQPVSKMMAEEIKAMRQWAAGRARLSSKPEAAPTATGRKLEIGGN